ncbi:MAG: methyltransferase domain-containing protein [Nitrospirae bacterium]|nr:methyltransferase domain-containing protein [Nitrospirota bacterium]MBF0535432.1 methyltransferase domain-containing protein [Nitrospirota bacterium]MBF0617620.1 methyltransferase domain-containing protein [Nitrospirota bacterium]
MIDAVVKPALRSIRKYITTLFIWVLKIIFKFRIFVKGEFIDLALRDGLFSQDELKEIAISYLPKLFSTEKLKEITLSYLMKIFSTGELKELIRLHGDGFSMAEAIQFEIQKGTISLIHLIEEIINSGLFNAGEVLSATIDTQTLTFIEMVQICLQKNYFEIRELYSALYIFGDGIEIGALNKPLKVPASARVSYVDRIPNETLEEHYSDIDSFLKVDIIDNGEKLSTIADLSQDFVIANHFLEHCENVIEALNNMLRVLKIKGILYFAVPDKRYTFDKDRQTTDFEHLLRDFHEGTETSRETHFRDWAEHVDKFKKEEDISRWSSELMAKGYSIHFHVWSQAEILEMLTSYKTISKYDFEMITVTARNGEIIIILERGEIRT